MGDSMREFRETREVPSLPSGSETQSRACFWIPISGASNSLSDG
jgi:hypothetical protein